jgi:hypothetical protein
MGERWLVTIAGFFPDLNFLSPSLSILANYLAVSLILYASLYLILKTTKKVASFVILLTLTPFVSLLIIDGFLDFRYTAVGRFYLPTFIGISLGVGFLLSEGCRFRKKLASIVGIALIVSGTIAKIPSPPGGSRFAGYGSEIPNGYPIVDRSPRPLIVAESWLDALPLLHVTEEKTEYLWVGPSMEIPPGAARLSDIFLLAPSEALVRKFERAGARLEPTENKAFWRVKGGFSP